jgi:membrane peptidoglycan carboxypeptidase
MSRAGATMSRAVLFVLVSVISGVLVAGLALPFVGTLGLAARTASDSYQEIPDVLQPPPLPQQSILLAADGSRLATFYAENRIVVSIDDINPMLQQAVVAVEDSRFYEHDGVDLRGTLRALATNSQSGQIQQGGSTLTMQYVKNVLLTSASTDEERAAANEQSVSRKLKEWRLATGLEKRWTKQQILEGYLNIAYFGAGAYGAEAASRRYFGRSAAKLTLPQAALLAGIVQQPVAFDPLRNPKSAEARRDVVLQRMLDQSYINQAQYDEAVATPIADTLRPKVLRNGCSDTYAPYFCDYVYQVILNDPIFGKTQDDREALLKRGGLVIKTTLDPKIQKETQKAVDQAIPRKDPSKKMAAAVFVQPGTGAILAMAENRTWGVQKKLGVTSINYTVDQKYNGTIGLQAGSTFKAFTLVAALQKGIPLSETINATSPKSFPVGSFTDCQGREVLTKTYSPHNSTGAGHFDMRRATAYSINTYFVELERRAGLCQTVQAAESLGVRTALGKRPSQVASFTLGTIDVSPLTMAEAYATLAASGLRCDSRAIASITTREGKKLAVPAKRCEQAIDSAVADGVTSLLAGVIDGPFPGRTGAPMSIGRPAAGKTGTTDDNAAVWFCGYTRELAGAVWVGDQRSGTKYPMHDVTINHTYYPEVFGRTFPGPIWKRVMEAALKGVPESQFPAIDPSVIHGVTVRVPDLTGLEPAAAVAQLESIGLTATVAVKRVASAEPAGRVAYTTPRAGASVSSGRTVTIYLSTGVPAPPPPPKPTPTPTPTPTLSLTPSPAASP